MTTNYSTRCKTNLIVTYIEIENFDRNNNKSMATVLVNSSKDCMHSSVCFTRVLVISRCVMQ